MTPPDLTETEWRTLLYNLEQRSYELRSKPNRDLWRSAIKDLEEIIKIVRNSLPSLT
jgi:hypothetical protein